MLEFIFPLAIAMQPPSYEAPSAPPPVIQQQYQEPTMFSRRSSASTASTVESQAPLQSMENAFSDKAVS